MKLFDNVGKKKRVIGLIHLKPMPGTPLYEEGLFEESLEKALSDAQALYRGGADGCLVQTVDKIYPSTDDTDYARVSAMAVITHAVKQVVGTDFHVGAQLMWNCITPSLAVTKIAGGTFTRATALIGSTASAFGTIEANPLKVQNYRKSINAQDIAIIAEIQGYHFNWLGDDMSIPDRARMAMMVGADAVEIMHGDEEINNKMVADIKASLPMLPVVLGGKTDLENVARRMKLADGVLVGSCFEGGKWGHAIDENIVKEYVGIVRSLEK
jgi:hypothetical protein